MWIDFSKGPPNLFKLKNQFFEKWQIVIFSFLEKWYDKNSFIISFTSGTIKKKKIFLKKEYMYNSACMTGKFFNLKNNDTALLCLSCKYIAAKMMLVRSAVLGLRIYCVSPSSKPLKNLNLFFDFVSMVPLQVFNSFSDFHYIKNLLIGGGPINIFIEKSLKNIDTNCYSSYGMTETFSHIALRKINGFNKSFWYKTLPEIKIDIDYRKCLKIFSPLLMEKPLQTNDLVLLKSPCYFKWLGRYDYLINIGGIKIIPEELEIKFQKFISRRFFISSLFDKILGEKLIMIIEGKFFDIKLPNKFFKGIYRFYKPKEFYFFPKFLETDSGKINRKEIIKNLNTQESIK